MPKRYIGDAVVTIDYMEDDTYEGNIKAGGYTWKFDGLRAPAVGLPYAYDSAEAYDRMAGAAASFGAYGDDEGGYDEKVVAEAISDAASWAQDDRGNYDVKRKKPKSGNPGKFEVIVDETLISTHNSETEAMKRAVQESVNSAGFFGPGWVRVVSVSDGKEIGCVEIKGRPYCNNPASPTSALKNKLLR